MGGSKQRRACSVGSVSCVSLSSSFFLALGVEVGRDDDDKREISGARSK